MSDDLKIVCVDLDGTLAHYDEWKGIENIGEPIEGAREFMDALRSEGFHIILYTCRMRGRRGNEMIDVSKIIVEWLRKHAINVDDIWGNEGKPFAHAYVDDRGVSCSPQNSPPAIMYAQAFHSALILAGEDSKTALPKAQKLMGVVKSLGGKIHLPQESTRNEHGGTPVDVG